MLFSCPLLQQKHSNTLELPQISLFSLCFSLIPPRLYSYYSLTQQFMTRSSIMSTLINPTVNPQSLLNLTYLQYMMLWWVTSWSLSLFPKTLHWNPGYHSLLVLLWLCWLLCLISFTPWFFLSSQTSKHWHAPDIGSQINSLPLPTPLLVSFSLIVLKNYLVVNISPVHQSGQVTWTPDSYILPLFAISTWVSSRHLKLSIPSTKFFLVLHKSPLPPFSSSL